MKMLFSLMLLIAAGLTSANAAVSRELVFKSDFNKNTGLKGWYDVHKWLPKNRNADSPKAEWYKVVSGKGGAFLRTSTMFGISSLLKPAVKIDDSVLEIELRVKLRKPKNDASLISFALSSRKNPAGTDGGPFWTGRPESGIIVKGYQYDIQYVNLIAWLKSGLRIHMSPIKPPFNLLTDVGKWVTWRLVYNNTEKQLSFYRNGSEKQAFIVQHNVDLSGVTLHSVWLGSYGTEYSQIEVYCTRQQK